MIPRAKTASNEASIIIKYPQPKVMLIDLDSEVEDVLEAEGFNVSSGSFGKPYKVPMGDFCLPVIPNGELPNFAEQEIVIVDLVPSEILNESVGEKRVSDGEVDLWASCSEGVIDPRPGLMAQARDDAERIYASGGLFVIFADARQIQNHFLGRMPKNYSTPLYVEDFPFDNWGFLPVLDRLEVKDDEGREISVTYDLQTSLGQLLVKTLKGTEFHCTLKPRRSIEESWATLAESKYGDPVAGALAPQESKGAVLILPQVGDKGRFVSELLKNVAPDFMPDLFPHAEGARWVQRPEYEIPEIQALKDKVRSVEEDARRKVSEFKQTIEAKRSETSYMHNLIGGTDRPLVLAVKKALEVMGFESVVDVDEEMEAAGDRGPRSEDLQIHDYSPTLLVEVKGISGMPSDEDALAVTKYLAPRMREWDRTDVRGLSVINHQRHVPALERENEKVFRKEVLTNAKQQEIGLLTTWDLHKLLRSYLKNGWRHEHVKPLTYQSGRISPVPSHYEPVGAVERFIENLGVVGIRITGEKLRRGNRIAFDLPVEFQEQEVESLEIDNQEVEEATSGKLAGILTTLTKEQAKLGARVFRVT